MAGRACIFGPHRIPPVFACHRVVVARIDAYRLFPWRAEGCAKRAFPDFQFHRHVAQTNGFINRLAVCGDVFNVVAQPSKIWPTTLDITICDGPVVNWNNNWVAAVFCECGQMAEREKRPLQVLL